MAQLECRGGPANGRTHEVKGSGKVVFMCHGDGEVFREAVYRLMLVFDEYVDTTEPEGGSLPATEGQNS